MIYEPSWLTVAIFGLFVGITLALSFYLAGKTTSAKGYFAAGGQIHWFVNGVAFAGDYLSAASFLGICGMIAFYGYDGFLYSIGYLAGWIVALFVIAEPLKRMGKYTFADALDSRFNSRGIKLAAAISTLVVSVFYLIPQMVGAGALVKPLLGFPHWVGVVGVGAVVVTIVVTAGMVSTTYVQFLKGSLLVIFSAILTVMLLNKGLTTEPGDSNGDFHQFRTLGPFSASQLSDGDASGLGLSDVEKLPAEGEWEQLPYLRVQENGTDRVTVWRIVDAATHKPPADLAALEADAELLLDEVQTVTITKSGIKLVNGQPQTSGGESGADKVDLHPVGHLSKLPDGKTETGPLGPLSYLATLQDSEVILWRKDGVTVKDSLGVTTIYYPVPTSGADALSPGNYPAFAGIRGDRFIDKLNFLSLMLALFCGTASLPHILIRYYTVKDQASARKSTIVGIAAIGFFYTLTLYLGLGAMVSGSLDVTDSNMAAPLLAKSMNELLFAMISAIAFTTVLGTVSGLIIAASGAVVHDLVGSVLRIEMNDYNKVRIGKIAAVTVGVVAMILGIAFEKFNVNYLVGWAFSVAASANLPSLVMLLFWKRTTKQGITAAIIVGMVASLGWILLSADTYKAVYGLSGESAIVPFSQPGIVTIPLGFLVLVVVSLMTPKPVEA